LGRRSSSDANNDNAGGKGHVGTGALTRAAERGSAILRREAIIAAYSAIRAHERSLMRQMLAGLAEIPGLRLYGISDPARIDRRCPTLAVRITGHTPLELATKLSERGIFTWDGNYYALNLTERLGVEQDGGFLRIGFVHYNTEEEGDRLLEAVKEIVG
jgi:selenocysteine lyase/cysteine desulfurase